mmetsp:Transcript_44300/g.111266  ORF Transcript_44300/g.111266 Transcript_44300/m.111266 type:complete len:215 (-) Transcript_44300:561-1205(-)
MRLFFAPGAGLAVRGIPPLKHTSLRGSLCSPTIRWRTDVTQVALFPHSASPLGEGGRLATPPSPKANPQADQHGRPSGKWRGRKGSTRREPEPPRWRSRSPKPGRRSPPLLRNMHLAQAAISAHGSRRQPPALLASQPRRRRPHYLRRCRWSCQCRTLRPQTRRAWKAAASLPRPLQRIARAAMVCRGTRSWATRTASRAGVHAARPNRRRRWT